MLMDKLLVILVTYNGERWLERCLNSVLESTIRADLFVVDNGSTDASVGIIGRMCPDAFLKISHDNLGFGGANNLGLQYALDNGYDYVYLLNQDAWVEPDTFEKLICASRAYPEYGILSPLQVNESKTRLDKNFSTHYPCSLPPYPYSTVPPLIVVETRFAMAAHWLMTRRCIEITGLFSPTFFHYGEDSNYVQRLHFHGLKIGVVPSAVAVHDRETRPETTASRRRQFHSYGLIFLSNPNSRVRYARWAVHLLSTLFSSPRSFSFQSLKSTLMSLGSISGNREISRRAGAFIKSRQ